MNVGQPILIRPERLQQPVNITGAGDVTVTYHVTFVDGAELVGTLRFTVEAESKASTNPSMTPSTATANTDEVVSASPHEHGIDPMSAVMLVVDGVVALAAIVLLVHRPRPRG